MTFPVVVAHHPRVGELAAQRLDLEAISDGLKFAHRFPPLSVLRCLHDWRSSPKRKARPPSVTDRWTGPSPVPAAMGHLSVRRGGLVAQPGLLDRILGLAMLPLLLAG